MTSTDIDPEAAQIFIWAVLGLHRVCPAAGGRPARCKCGEEPKDCSVWCLADGLLGLWPEGLTSAGTPLPDGRQPQPGPRSDAA